MNSPLVLARINAMTGYTPGEQPKGQPVTKLNTNENPYPPSPAVVAAIRDFPFSDLRKYPPPGSDCLIQAATQVYGVPAGRVLAGNGSDELLTMLVRTFAGEGDAIGAMDPTYSLYTVLAEIQGCRYFSVPLRPDFSFPDAETVAEQANEAGCKLFFITRPNAPTGNCYPVESVRRFAQVFQGAVVVDEAYADFAADNCLSLIDELENVLVLRTFSKSYSLAGLRVGLCFAREAIIHALHKVRDSYNVDFIAQRAAAAALLDTAYHAECCAKVKATRVSTVSRLRALGFDCPMSESNFLFARPPAGQVAKELLGKLRQSGFLVRWFDIPGIDNRLRISIGSDAEMEAFFAALEGCLK